MVGICIIIINPQTISELKFVSPKQTLTKYFRGEQYKECVPNTINEYCPI